MRSQFALFIGLLRLCISQSARVFQIASFYGEFPNLSRPSERDLDVFAKQARPKPDTTLCKFKLRDTCAKLSHVENHSEHLTSSPAFHSYIHISPFNLSIPLIHSPQKKLLSTHNLKSRITKQFSKPSQHHTLRPPYLNIPHRFRSSAKCTNFSSKLPSSYTTFSYLGFTW